jgi:hypothetical protein
MDIKCKTCDIRTWEKHLFLNISSTKIDTLALSMCQNLQLLFQPLLHLRFNLFVVSETFATKMVFLQTKQMEVTEASSPVCKADVENSLPGCSGCMRSGIVMMKPHPSCQLAWTFSVNSIPKLLYNFTV